MPGTTMTIARKEMLERLVTRRYIVLLAVTSFTMLLAFVSASQTYRTHLENYTASMAEGGEHMALHMPSPLSILAYGVGDELGRRFNVDKGLGLIDVSGQPIRAASLFQLLPPIDVLYVIQVLLSLVAALLVFDSVAGEKQRGSLALLLSHGVSRASVFAGKWLGGHIVLATVLAPSFLAGLLWVSAGDGIRLPSSIWPHLLAFFLLASTYLSFFLTLGLMISCFLRRPATSSVIILLVWTLLVFILPGLTAQWSSWRIPLPDAQRMASWNAGVWTSRVFERETARRDGQTIEGSLAAEVFRATGGLDRDFFARASQRVRLHKQLALFSPVSSLIHGATAITATGPSEELRFKGDLLAYRANVIGGEGETSLGPLIVGNLAQNESWVQEALPHFLALVAGTAAAFLVGLWGFNRYDPR